MSCIAYLSHIVAYVAKLKRNACWEKKKKREHEEYQQLQQWKRHEYILLFFSNTLSFFPWCLCVTLTTNRSSRFAYNRKAKMRLETFVVCKTKAFLKCYLYVAVAFVFDNILTILFSIRFGAVTSFQFLCRIEWVKNFWWKRQSEIERGKINTRNKNKIQRERRRKQTYSRKICPIPFISIDIAIKSLSIFVVTYFASSLFPYSHSHFVNSTESIGDFVEYSTENMPFRYSTIHVAEISCDYRNYVKIRSVPKPGSVKGN